MASLYGAVDRYDVATDDSATLTPRIANRHYCRLSITESIVQASSFKRWYRVTALAVSLMLITASLFFHATITTLFRREVRTATNTQLLFGASSIDAFDEQYNQEHHDEHKELFYHDQLVNHFNDNNKDTWKNRYYKSTTYFEGPGHPIFMLNGGEGVLGHMVYPFITQHLASYFGAAVIQIEHRFYGPYPPVKDATVSDLLELLTPQQAMADMVRLGKEFKKELKCSYHRDSSNYCPIITVGASYPGNLAALLRLVYPDFVDIAYASSAPLRTHTQLVDQNVYYDIVTNAAEHASPGCANAVRMTLMEARDQIKEEISVTNAAGKMNLCLHTLPQYITNLDILSVDVMMAVGFSFANYDMDAYPPGPNLGLYKACRVFQDEDLQWFTPLEKVGIFFQLVKQAKEGFKTKNLKDGVNNDSDCFDLSVFLPDGEHATITTSDWSGSGGGNDGKMWDFQLCTKYIAPIGFSSESMFPPRKWTYKHLTTYCQLRYGKKVVPQPYELVKDFGFDDLVGNGASRILFTNGKQDMWYGGSYTEDLSDTILALNFENGAHHSDLTHIGPQDDDTDDIKEGHIRIKQILEKWLDDMRTDNSR